MTNRRNLGAGPLDEGGPAPRRRRPHDVVADAIDTYMGRMNEINDVDVDDLADAIIRALRENGDA